MAVHLQVAVQFTKSLWWTGFRRRKWRYSKGSKSRHSTPERDGLTVRRIGDDHQVGVECLKAQSRNLKIKTSLLSLARIQKKSPGDQTEAVFS
jgi:hypothetical protein